MVTEGQSSQWCETSSCGSRNTIKRAHIFHSKWEKQRLKSKWWETLNSHNSKQAISYKTPRTALPNGIKYKMTEIMGDMTFKLPQEQENRDEDRLYMRRKLQKYVRRKTQCQSFHLHLNGYPNKLTQSDKCCTYHCLKIDRIVWPIIFNRY